MKKLRLNKKFTLAGLIVLVIGAGAYFALWQEGLKPSVLVSIKDATSTPSATVDPKILDFGLKIDKINVLVPVIKNVDGADKAVYNDALKNGVAHFAGTALPGEARNIFIFGHSSSDVKSDYSKIFARLDDLATGDEISVYLEGKEHKYKVSDKKVVEADDLSVLEKGNKEELTLMTCWPIGTKAKRLIVRAK